MQTRNKDFLVTPTGSEKPYYRYYVLITNPDKTLSHDEDCYFDYKTFTKLTLASNQLTQEMQEIGLVNDTLFEACLMTTALKTTEGTEAAQGYISNDYLAIQLQRSKEKKPSRIILIDTEEPLFNHNQPKETAQNQYKIEEHKKREDHYAVYYDSYDKELIHITRSRPNSDKNIAVIALEEGHRARVSAFVRERGMGYDHTLHEGLYIKEWASHHTIPSEYTRLAGQTKNWTDFNKNPNPTIDLAHRVARIFKDYQEKGKGFSAFIHGHWNRHHENLMMAGEIAYTLQKEYQQKSPLAIARYLAEKVSNLEIGNYQLNPRGSFARRINYVMLQLTNGLCHSLAEFKQYQEQQIRHPLKPKD